MTCFRDALRPALALLASRPKGACLHLSRTPPPRWAFNFRVFGHF